MKKLLKNYFKKNPLYSKILAVKRLIKPPVRIWGSSSFNFSSSDSFFGGQIIIILQFLDILILQISITIKNL